MPQESTVYELYLGMRLPGLSGRSFSAPLGIVNGASFAPAGNPIAPGEFISLFGTNLAPRYNRRAAYPPVLGGVTVTINNCRPISRISSTQINALVPYGIAGSTATIVVNNNGQTSNSVQVP